MGNRAVITTPEKQIAIYLHWCGGRDTVEPLLKYCELQGYRPPSEDCYGWARMAQVMGNFFGGSLSLGIDTYSRLQGQGDNGTYIIDGWKIVGRGDLYDGFTEQNENGFYEMLHAFDQAMPERCQLGDFLDAQEIPTSDIKIGDAVYMREHEDRWQPFEVIGFGECSCNGKVAAGIPYVARYDHDGDYSWNINNYVRTDTCRIKPR